LIRNFHTLLNQCLNLVGGNDARTGYDFPFSVRFKRGDFEIQELGTGVVEQHEGKLACLLSGNRRSRQIYTRRVRQEVRRRGNLPSMESRVGKSSAKNQALLIIEGIASSSCLIMQAQTGTQILEKLSSASTMRASIMTAFRHVDFRDQPADILKTACAIMHKQLVRTHRSWRCRFDRASEPGSCRSAVSAAPGFW
jgi:hypothetical protein